MSLFLKHLAVKSLRLKNICNNQITGFSIEFPANFKLKCLCGQLYILMKFAMASILFVKCYLFERKKKSFFTCANMCAQNMMRSYMKMLKEIIKTIKAP